MQRLSPRFRSLQFFLIKICIETLLFFSHFYLSKNNKQTVVINMTRQRTFLRHGLSRYVNDRSLFVICMETSCWCPSLCVRTWRPETNRNTDPSLSLATKASIYLSRNSKMNCSDSQTLRNESHF